MGVPVIVWNGDLVRRKVANAVKVGVDATMADAVRGGKADHATYPPASAPFERYANRTDDLTAGITIKVPAFEVAGHVRGVWGALSDYSLLVEIGTSREGSGYPTAVERAAADGGDMWDVAPPSDPPQMAPRPTLRPAADAAYAGLGARIGAAFRAGV